MRVRGKGGLAEVPEAVWTARGQANALATFRRAARTVPAYRAFLKEHGIRPRDVRTYEDFEQLPTTSKENYLLRYDLAELMSGGGLGDTYIITQSSGYSGQPLFWPRFKRQDDQPVKGMQALYSLYDVFRKSTLALNTFSLDTHVGGQCCTDFSLRVARGSRARLALATPGPSVEDTLELVTHLSRRFEQTILWGYPSLVHKIVVTGAEQGVQWSDLNTFVICAGEGFSEDWRRVMVGLLGCSPHPMRVGALYGSADGSLMGFDTPVSIATKQLAHDHKGLQSRVFRGQPPVAFVQFNPIGRFFESISGELALTCWQAVPMIRYVLHDIGDVLPFSTLMKHLECAGMQPDDTLADLGIQRERVWQWPFLSCFGRSDGTVSILGANVYPHALQHVFAVHREAAHFKLAVDEDAGGSGRLTVYVEWADGVPPPEVSRRLECVLHDEVLQALLARNADYRTSFHEDPDACDPRIVVVAAGTGPFASDAGRWKRAYTESAKQPGGNG